ncbi:NYN domain-containing protein [Aeoliella sp.]|uniref:NYN domain-containing protein n=1 Tax=Aeoliella sp. TaxID=2795800 RepID=UPI003CCB9BDB
MNEKKLALLVDGENIAPEFAEEILHKAGTLGIVSVRIVYGEFRRTTTPPWQSPVVKALGFDLCRVKRAFRCSNSTDEAICRAAKRLVRRGTAEAVCIVSADGDFAALAEELIAEGNPCFGIGPNDASKKLKSSCSEFLCLGDSSPVSGPIRKQQIRVLRVAVTAHANKNGWAKIQAVEDYLQIHSTLYRQQRWGFASISEVFMATNQFELQDFPDNQYRVRHIA